MTTNYQLFNSEFWHTLLRYHDRGSMLEGTRNLLRGPWTAGKVWALVSIPLSVAGVANITDSFLDLGSLVVYLLIFYQYISTPIIDTILLIFRFDINRYFLDYLIIGSPLYFGTITFMLYASGYFFYPPKVFWAIRNIRMYDNMAAVAAIFFVGVLLTFSICILWPIYLIVCIKNWKFYRLRSRHPDRVSWPGRPERVYMDILKPIVSRDHRSDALR